MSGREKTLGLAVAGTLIAFLLIRVVLAPGLTRFRALLGRQEQLESKYLRARRNLLMRESVAEAREAYQREISSQGSEQEEQSFLLREIERLSRDLPIRIRGMRPLPSEDKGFYKRFAVSMEIEASVENTMQFIHTIESSPRLLRVESLQLTADGKKRGWLLARALVSRPAVVGSSSEGRMARGGTQ
jgi:Tfp pilus assembly protein PilO